MAVVQLDPGEGMSLEDQQAQAEALRQGEAIAKALEEDKRAAAREASEEEVPVELIAGKFRSQDELLKAYKELESKLGKKTPEDDQDAAEGQQDASQDDSDDEGADDTAAEEEEAQLVPFSRAAEEYAQKGQLSDEAIEELAKMDTKDLIKGYLEFYGKTAQQAQQAQLQESQIAQVKQSVGGDAAYAEMVGWAAENFSAEEKADFNAVMGTASVPAIKFAIQSLKARYERAEGREGKLVTGRKAKAPAVKGYRSHAEMLRDMANPKYDNDPAFRQDVMAKLAASGALL